MTGDAGRLAEMVRSAFEEGDLDALSSLCAEDVHWGAPGDPGGGCQNREQARAWFRAAYARGVRASVNEIVATPGGLLVGVTVSGSAAAGAQDGPVDRWQVLTVRDDRITDICGFDDRAEAAAWAGLAP